MKESNDASLNTPAKSTQGNISTLPTGRSISMSNNMSRIYWETESVWERRIFALLVAKIRDNKNHEQELSCAEIIAACRNAKEISTDEEERSSYRHLYRNISDVADRLQNKKIRIKDDASGGFRQHVLCPDFEWEPGKEKVMRIGFNPSLLEHIINLHEYFTQYDLLDLLRLRSNYSQALFQLLKSWARSVPYIDIERDELCDYLNVKKYIRKNSAEIRRRILEPASREINELTKLHFEWEMLSRDGQKGRRVIRFVFVKPEAAIPSQAENDEAQKGKPKGAKDKTPASMFLKKIAGGAEQECVIPGNELATGVSNKAQEFRNIGQEDPEMHALCEIMYSLGCQLVSLINMELKYTPVRKQDPEELLLGYGSMLAEQLKEFGYEHNDLKAAQVVISDVFESLRKRDEWPRMKEVVPAMRAALSRMRAREENVDPEPEEGMSEEGIMGFLSKQNPTY